MVTVKYRVWCTVSGGRTGPRQSWLSEKGEPREFATLEEAAKVAKTLDDSRNGNPFRTADFSYTAKEIREIR